MKTITHLTMTLLTLLVLCLAPLADADAEVALPKEQLLWPNGTSGVIEYVEENVRSSDASAMAPSKSNRVFSNVDKPSYTIHQCESSKANGVGLVICPGGGYRDVWLDREGHDLAIWLKEYGVTSLVLKYRTNGSGPHEGRKYKWDDYLQEVVADARQAVRVLRKDAKQLAVDPEKIGISGFSAGGNLALQVALLTKDQSQNEISSDVNFIGLFYPWLRTDAYKAIDTSKKSPPTFIMNAADDWVTPASRCIEFYSLLLKSKATPELHIVSRGGHGFDLGEGRDIASAPLWKQSFLAWLQDTGLSN